MSLIKKVIKQKKKTENITEVNWRVWTLDCPSSSPSFSLLPLFYLFNHRAQRVGERERHIASDIFFLLEAKSSSLLHLSSLSLLSLLCSYLWSFSNASPHIGRFHSTGDWIPCLQYHHHPRHLTLLHPLPSQSPLPCCHRRHKQEKKKDEEESKRGKKRQKLWNRGNAQYNAGGNQDY